MVITSKHLPQLYAYEDEEAKRILRNLKKVEIKNEYKLVDLGVREYVSIPKLDQKAFRYIEKHGKLYLRESVTSVGGLVQDSVLINLGDFTIGDDETGEELEYLVRVKDAKAKQRARQLQECERIAQATLQRIQKQLKNDEILKKWQSELQEDRRFVRFGKEDYYQSQVAIIAKYAKDDETLAKLLVDYDQKINEKNKKWLTQPLKLAKAKNAAERIATAPREDIGELDPAKREAFDQYYAVRAPQMTPYLTSEEEVVQELPPAPAIIATKQVATTQTTTQVAAQENTSKKAKAVNTGIKQMKQAFRNTKSKTAAVDQATVTADKSEQSVSVSQPTVPHKKTAVVKTDGMTVRKQQVETASQTVDDDSEMSR